MFSIFKSITTYASRAQGIAHIGGSIFDEQVSGEGIGGEQTIPNLVKWKFGGDDRWDRIVSTHKVSVSKSLSLENKERSERWVN